MTLLEAHTQIAQAVTLGIQEVITEAIEQHKVEMAKRNRQVGPDDYRWTRVR